MWWLLRENYHTRREEGEAGSCPADHSVSRRSSSRHQQNVFARGQANTSVLGTPWSQVAAQRGGGLPARGFKGFRQPRHNSRRGKARGELLVCSPLWGEEAVGLPLVDKVDCKHRKCAQRRRANGGLLLQRHEGQRESSGFLNGWWRAFEARCHSSQETGVLPVASILQRMRRRDWRPFERPTWRLFLSVLARGATALFGVASRGRTPLHGGIWRSGEFTEGRSSMAWTEGAMRTLKSKWTSPSGSSRWCSWLSRFGF